MLSWNCTSPLQEWSAEQHCQESSGSLFGRQNLGLHPRPAELESALFYNAQVIHTPCAKSTTIEGCSGSKAALDSHFAELGWGVGSGWVSSEEAFLSNEIQNGRRRWAVVIQPPWASLKLQEKSKSGNLSGTKPAMLILRVLSMCPGREQRPWSPSPSKAFSLHSVSVPPSSRSHLIGDICLPLGLHAQLQNRSVNVFKQDSEPSDLLSASPDGHRRLRCLEVCAISAEAAALTSWPGWCWERVRAASGRGFPTPWETAATTSSILLTLHGPGPWKQAVSGKWCSLSSWSKGKALRRNQTPDPPPTAGQPRVQSPHLENERMGLGGLLNSLPAPTVICLHPPIVGLTASKALSGRPMERMRPFVSQCGFSALSHLHFPAVNCTPLRASFTNCSIGHLLESNALQY